MRRILIALSLLLAAAASAMADECCYPIPVEITQVKGGVLRGYLRMYGDEIRGKSKEGKIYIVSFGMNEPSADERIWESVNYEFEEILIRKRVVRVGFGKDVFEVRDVTYFLSPEGLKLYATPADGPPQVVLPMKKIARIKRIGPIGGKLDSK